MKNEPPRRWATLSPEKRELLEKRLRGAGPGSSGPNGIPRRPEHDVLPLSFAQERLWVFDQLEPGSPAYNRPSNLRLVGPLDVGALERSLTEIVRRHEALRTTFGSSDGSPFQRVAPARPLSLAVLDLGHLPPAEREARERQAVTDEARQPFDLTRPLLRARLLRLGEAEHVLMLTIHHIVFDGWSMGVLKRELGALYDAFAEGRESPLPELPVQYGDFAVWQRQGLQGETLERHLAYWKRQLSGAPAVLELPTDRPRPAQRSSRGAKASLRLSSTLTAALEALSRREGATLFMTCLAAFQTLLSRYTGQEHIVVGTPIAGRTRGEIEGLIGVFINTLVLRGDLSGDPPFRELLGRARAVAAQAYAHQDLPFSKLVEELQPERNLRHTPLFQVMLNFRNMPGQEARAGKLGIEDVRVDGGVALVDLTLEVIAEPGGLRCVFEYSTDLFDETTVARMLGHLQTLLASIVADPDRRVSELTLLTEGERRQLLVEWVDTASDYPRDACVHELFERQARRTPDAVAITHEGEELSYRELDARANMLARFLRARGVGPEVLVGVYAERSLETVVGLLGVLKAGGAYVPLDPAYPRERVAFMLEDARVPVLLTQERLLERLPRHAAHVLCLDTGWHEIARERNDSFDSGATAQNLAYVIYTSGSTGQPKGVGVQHDSLTNLVTWHRRAYGITPADRATQLASLAFDASAYELWPYLTAGASIHIPTEELRLSPSALLQWLGARAVTICLLPTPIAEAVLKERLPSDLSLRYLLTGGDQLHQGPDKVLPFELVNLYGPTESTVVTTSAPVAAAVPGAAPPPIGRPIANTSVYVLDAHLNPVPVGVPGELYIGGEGLARGYLNRAALTAQRFVPNPFGEDSGTRLYRTGDLARYLPGGNIEFLGRVDYQVKVRGYRIELGEVEAVLVEQAGVREAVVVAREDAPGEKRLVAYVVADRRPAPSDRELRGGLKAKLPDYMLPSAFVLLDALPLTPNGKVDRRALPVPEAADLAPGATYVAPRTPAEEVVARIWSEVLKRERVGAHDNFFDLGGHSLSATRMVARVRETLKVQLAVRSVFEEPTVAGFAARIEASRRAVPARRAPALVPVPRNADLPLSFAQQRLWFLDQLQPDTPYYNVARAVRLRGVLNVEALRRALSRIVARHEALRTTFVAVDGRATQRVAADVTLPVSVTDLRGLAPARRDAETRTLVSEAARRPFDLARGPLLCASLLRLDEAEHVLIVVVHHIVFDAWSMDVFNRELGALYEAFAAGAPSPLPALPIQYADFAVWQRAWLAGERLQRQLAYWKRELADVPVLELPTDRPRPAVKSYEGASESRLLPPHLAEALRALSRQQGATLFMTLLAAFQVLLARYSGQEDIVVGSPIAGRTRVEVEGLIGFFLNTLALRTDLSGDPTFRELLGRVREVALNAYAHQDVPFEKLVEELQLERSLSHSPIFQVMFTLQNAPNQTLEIAGLKLEALEADSGTEKFDLTLFAREVPDGLACRLNYSTDLFDPATIGGMMGHYQTLLEGIVADPEERVAQLPLLNEAERHRLLVEWNETGARHPQDRCLHELFEAQAARTPERVAAEFEGERLTYRELNARANRLAHHLIRHGVVSETLVAVCVERSLEMLVGILGILKAGGAYVPLDAAYPTQRLAFMLADTGAPVLVTQESLLARLPEHEATTICLDSDRVAIARERALNPGVGVRPGSLAYVIYTSGSTGKPKGVAIEHRSAVVLLDWAREVFEPEDLAGVLASTSIAFDLSVFEIFVPLASGGGIILAENALRLPALAAAERVTLVNTVPSAMAELLRMGGLPASVRTVNLAGEFLPAQLVERIYRHTGVRRVFDLYGPSEDTTYSTFALRSPNGPATIGRPIANTQVYLLDRHRQPVPVGVIGELYLAGGGLARGYLNRPELTAERFVPNPFGGAPGARMYRTGDLARYRADGTIEYVGRVDHQVKVRGFRVELGEIEAVLRERAGVREAVVVLREDAPGDKRLVAYVVAGRQSAPSVGELRGVIKGALPDYMVPSAFVELQELPRTPGGKVDRKALPVPERGRGELTGGHVAPRTPLEEAVAGIWAEVLRTERVGIHDNFFELGGHSLLATQVMSRVGESLQAGVPLRCLFESPTVAGLAEAIARSRTEGADDDELARMVAELEALSDEEARRLMADGHPGDDGQATNAESKNSFRGQGRSNPTKDEAR